MLFKWRFCYMRPKCTGFGYSNSSETLNWLTVCTPRILLMVCSPPHSLCDLKAPEHPKTSHRGGDVYRRQLFFLFNLTRLPFENGFMGFHILALEAITRYAAPLLKSSAAERGVGAVWGSERAGGGTLKLRASVGEGVWGSVRECQVGGFTKAWLFHKRVPFLSGFGCRPFFLSIQSSGRPKGRRKHEIMIIIIINMNIIISSISIIIIIQQWCQCTFEYTVCKEDLFFGDLLLEAGTFGWAPPMATTPSDEAWGPRTLSVLVHWGDWLDQGEGGGTGFLLMTLLGRRSTSWLCDFGGRPFFSFV